MSFLELAQQRFSVRSFRPEPIPLDKIHQILEAGIAAPTACNHQPQKITVVNSEDGLARLKKCTNCHYNAPLALIVSYDRATCWQRSYDGKTSGDIDASIVATHMMLEAADLKIGSTWIMYFDPQKLKEEFDLTENLEPVAILVMGYPTDDCKPSELHNVKRNSEELVSFC